MARVYVRQYGFWWSLTPEQALRWLAVARIEDKEWNLSDYGQELKGRPSCVRGDKDNGYYTTDDSLIFRQPVDWARTEYAYAREDVERLLNRHKDPKHR